MKKAHAAAGRAGGVVGWHLQFGMYVHVERKEQDCMQRVASQQWWLCRRRRMICLDMHASYVHAWLITFMPITVRLSLCRQQTRDQTCPPLSGQQLSNHETCKHDSAALCAAV